MKLIPIQHIAYEFPARNPGSCDRDHLIATQILIFVQQEKCGDPEGVNYSIIFSNPFTPLFSLFKYGAVCLGTIKELVDILYIDL